MIVPLILIIVGLTCGIGIVADIIVTVLVTLIVGFGGLMLIAYFDTKKVTAKGNTTIEYKE